MMYKNSAFNELCNSNISNFQSPATYDSFKYLTYMWHLNLHYEQLPNKGCWYKLPLYMLPQHKDYKYQTSSIAASSVTRNQKG